MTTVSADSSSSAHKFSLIVFALPFLLAGVAFAVIKPEFAIMPFGLFCLSVLVLNRSINWKRVVLMSLIVIGFGSCASPNYWGASATPYGQRAQRQYIKSQRGHNPSHRFQSSSQPTFGAQDVSRNR